jgi:predicted house-cleaning noncanonical NTP pyrophosphatase (MazG superfamily)
VTARNGKLIRDGVPQLIRAQGLEPVLRVAEPDEHVALLLAKLREEATEVEQAIEDYADSVSPAAVVGELADVMEVLFAIADCIGSSRAEVEEARIRKAAERGGFAQRLVWSGNRPG